METTISCSLVLVDHAELHSSDRSSVGSRQRRRKRDGIGLQHLSSLQFKVYGSGFKV